MPQQMIWFFLSMAFSFIAWGIVAARYIWPELRVRQRAEALEPLLILHSFRFRASAHPAQLPLHRVGGPGPRRRVTRTAACLRIFRGLWGRHCGDTCVAFAAIAAQRGRRCCRVDIQPLGHSRSAQLFLPSPSRRTIGGAVGSRILYSDVCRAPAADHARTDFPDSSATSTCICNARKPAPGIRFLGPRPARRNRALACYVVILRREQLCHRVDCRLEFP